MTEHLSPSDDTSDIAHGALQSPKDQSGYTSSTEDHFSDAHEDADDDQASEDALDTNQKVDGAAESTDATITVDQHTTQPPTPFTAASTDIVIPGAFDDAEETVETKVANPEDSGSTESHDVPSTHEEVLRSGSPEQTAAYTEPGTTQMHIPETEKELENAEGGLEIQATLEEEKGADEGSPEVVVRWNSKEDKIRRTVSKERQRIEKTVEEEGTRSVSPASSPETRRKATMNEIIDTNGTTNGAPPVIGDLIPGETSTNGGDTTPSAATNDIETPPSPTVSIKSTRGRRRRSSAASRGRATTTSEQAPPTPALPAGFAQPDEGGGFGDDDFDDFGEVVEGDDDFDDFEAFEEPETNNTPVPPMEAPPQLQLPIPVLDMDLGGSMADELTVAMNKMFPFDESKRRKPSSVEGRPFLTERSLSLWSQLVAPPPLQPPNWKLSRIRRLFLVSLGVPVDLDEILPAETKQKKLVLPSVNLPRKSTDSRPSSSSNSRANSRTRQKKGSNEPGVTGPEALDIPNARILCSTSEMALNNLTVDELKAHVARLESVTTTASEVLTYWLRKRDGAMGDKEAFETVIESLVGYARKKRQNR